MKLMLIHIAAPPVGAIADVTTEAAVVKKVEDTTADPVSNINGFS